MPKTAPVPPHMQPAAPVEQQAKADAGSAAVRYSISLCLLALLSLAAAFWAATRPWFVDRYAPPVIKVIGYGRRAAGMNCDVVLYGDSTALTGLDPEVIQRETGLTACNIAEARPVLQVTGVNAPLDQYLAHNRPPKFLIAAWSAGDFDLGHPRMNSYSPDGYLYEFQYDRGPWLWKELLFHPKDTVSFLVWVQGEILNESIDRLGSRPPNPVNDRTLRDSRKGVWQVPRPPQSACEKIPSYPWFSHDKYRDDVAKFRERFAPRTKHLLVDVTPSADCFVEGKSGIARVQGLYDNTAELWPVSSFNSFNLHLTRQGAERFSAQVAQQIESILQQERESSGERGAATR